MKFNYKVDIMEIFFKTTVFLGCIFFIVCCERNQHKVIEKVNRTPSIEPDFVDVTIPPNIAPLNFEIREEGKNFTVNIKSGKTRRRLNAHNGVVRFPLKIWKKMLSDPTDSSITIEIISNDKNRQKYFAPVKIFVARESLDPYLCYRLIFPGYQSWGEMKIIQRSVEAFNERIIFDNRLVNGDCVNCHSFNQNDPSKFLLHVRGPVGGTYMSEGKKVIRKNLRVGEMNNNAVYPAWHPSGKYVVFSSNEIIQAYNLNPDKKIVVYDQESPMVIYSVENNEMKFIGRKDSIEYICTFPVWSPEGDFLYYCRTGKLEDNFNYKEIKYSLARKAFNISTGEFGSEEVLFDACSNAKSVSLPRISPDGKYMVIALTEFGTFPVWHKDADLYLVEIESKKVSRMALNSDQSESYASWSSNGKWLVFSSKRDDGLTARPYFAYIHSADSTGKPFILPQKDPGTYARMDNSFNRPEFITGKVKTSPRDFMRAAKHDPINANWTEISEY